ncbi:MAG: HEAT repeat domain-containing protein [Elusimicrobiota bacterium]
MNKVNLNFSGETRGPNTTTAKTNLPISYNAFAKPLRCSLSNFTRGIISQLKTFVNIIGITQSIYILILLLILPGQSFAEERGKITKERINVAVEIKNLKNKNLSKKLSAIERLGKARDKEATAELVKELKTEGNPNIKSKIVESLACSQDKSTAKEVENLLKTDPNSEVRFSAAYSLGYAQDKSVVPTLMETFLNEKEQIGVRLQAANALTNYPPTEEIYQCFSRGLGNPNPTIRMQAVTSLSLSFGAASKNKIVPLLKKMLKDKEAAVRNVTRERLEFLGIK